MAMSSLVMKRLGFSTITKPNDMKGAQDVNVTPSYTDAKRRKRNFYHPRGFICKRPFQ